MGDDTVKIDFASRGQARDTGEMPVNGVALMVCCGGWG